ncbi:hypothetical protein [Ruegeria hyattellae]|uniref:hypothetical protein n=1 Tax=Ruegeria hyattellae TaxID=3233337 RepID=UPI00355C4066
MSPKSFRVRWYPALIVLSCLPIGLKAEVEQYLPAPAHDPSQAWCEGDLFFSPGAGRFPPEGGLVEIGGIVVRVCQAPPPTRGPDERVMRLLVNPRRVPGLAYNKTASGIIISSLGSYDLHLKNIVEQKKKVGGTKFGETGYDIYKYFDESTSRFIEASDFVYMDRPDNTDGIPPHIISCNKKFTRHPDVLAFCRVFIDYKDIRVQLLFAGGGPVASPLPLQLFPEFAKDLVRVMEAVDVTDDVEHLRKSLPYWDQHEQ